jgi:hypothetical protein
MNTSNPRAQTPNTAGRQNEIIRPAIDFDRSYVVSLQRKFSNQLGFIPAAGLDVYISRGSVLLSTENGEPAGYVLHRAPSRRDAGVAKIIQTAVQLDAQRRSHGLALVESIAAQHAAAGAELLQACVRSDLESNAFFNAAGFRPVAIRSAPSARELPHIIWRRPLTPAGVARIAIVAAPRCLTGPGGRWLRADQAHLAYVVRPPTLEELANLTRAA